MSPITRPFDSDRRFVLIPDAAQVRQQGIDAAQFEVPPEDMADSLRLVLNHRDLAILGLIAEWNDAPNRRPLRLEAAILSPIDAPLLTKPSGERWKQSDHSRLFRRAVLGAEDVLTPKNVINIDPNWKYGKRLS